MSAAPRLPRSGRCLVLALDGLGDMVLRQPLLRGLADAGYEVHVLVQAGHERLLRFLDERLRGTPAPLSWTSPPTVATVHALFDVVRKGVVKVQVRQTYPLREVAQAHRDLQARKTTGSTVLLVE